MHSEAILSTARLNIINVGYDAANYYLLAAPQARLLIDVDWPGTLPRLRAALKRMGSDLAEVTHLLVTHYHPDHAGLAQELKRLGIKLIVLENQPAGIMALKQYMKPDSGYVEITPHDNIVLRSVDSCAFLRGLGIAGEILPTPGHSDDSVTLLLDSGAAFIGDLPAVRISDDPAHPANVSMEQLLLKGARLLYPGHGPLRPLP